MNDLDPTVCPASTRLVGREADLSFIQSFFANSQVQGAALLLSGEAGVGKSAVLDAVATGAVHNGIRVLRAAGVQFEADISYAGLNQLLVPLFDYLDVLDNPHRDALRVAVGIGSGPVPDRLLTSTAVLLLLRLISAETPLLIVVDDLPWLDRATNAVLGFVARRLVGSRIGFLAASREGSDSFFESSGLTEHRLKPLDDASSAELLALAHPDISPAVRRRIAAEARGNPLALVELPVALSTEQRATLAAVPTVLPLTERLQSMFASRVAALPERSRELLLIAALDGTGDLAAIEAAAAGRAGVDDLAPAERDRLVAISADNRRLTFRHPLIGSAVVELATASERRRAHRALAGVLGEQLERRAWHLGEAAVGPDETVAALLEEAARRRLRRGDALGAVTALTRAAGLSPTAADESRRLAEAAYVGVDSSGELEDASRLLAGARLVHPGTGQQSLHAAAASAFLLINRDGDIDTAYRLLVGAIESGDHGWDASDDALIEALHLLVLLCWYGGAPELWQPLFTFMDRLTPEPPELLWVISQTFGDPARTGPSALPRLTELIATVGDDPTRVVRVGTASVFPDRLGDFRWATRRLIEQGRAGTAPVRRHLGALMHLGLDYYHLGRWEDAAQLAAEGLTLCTNHDYRFFAWYFHYIQAAVAAAQGDAETAAALTEEIVRWATPRGAHGARYFACHARALAALGNGDYETAYQHACTLSPPGTVAPYVPIAMWGTMDLVEAAVRTGREEEAAAHAAAMRASSMGGLSPRLELLVLACEALAAPGEESVALFERALSLPGPERWPFDAARVRLFHGERLRRLRATAEAREQLTQALEVFQRLGAKPWVARTAAELRASGLSAPTATRPGPVTLTAQELQIATLAATGLTNKQIAERLFLSHRTIGTHLYQIYPKLGITSRAALRDALSGLDLDRED
ncbi:LuxR family transcriptional regulator [Streptomyces olivaceoviridis]|uniref:helix-turn-helix transcriptional regulator n=1 Tax=Streptomyces olivaceoviridis TaxID=1921 RepID=UPI001678EEBF|nr:LuxR family transcriptional regulator [Streptomyces olivaceoviridis]GGZ27727.1 LuxR family transcriptional regulator [Streptomyces olivaceoviridis]